MPVYQRARPHVAVVPMIDLRLARIVEESPAQAATVALEYQLPVPLREANAVILSEGVVALPSCLGALRVNRDLRSGHLTTTHSERGGMPA